MANPTWSNPLEAPGILLIDEIELHLHPRWQQSLQWQTQHGRTLLKLRVFF